MKYTLPLLLLSACSHITYEARSDGSTFVEGWEFGTNVMLSGAIFETHSDGSRSLKLDSLDTDRVDGLAQINQGLSLIIEGAAKGIK